MRGDIELMGVPPTRENPEIWTWYKIIRLKKCSHVSVCLQHIFEPTASSKYGRGKEGSPQVFLFIFKALMSLLV